MESEKRKFVVDWCLLLCGDEGEIVISSSGAFKERSRPQCFRRRCGNNGITARAFLFKTPVTGSRCIFPSSDITYDLASGVNTRDALTKIGEGEKGKGRERYERGKVT